MRVSAGEQQRVGIIRAIVNIADRPTGNLDLLRPWSMKSWIRLIFIGTTILMVTHAKDIVDQMDDGSD